MTAVRRSHDDERDVPSLIGALGSSAGGADRADPVFQPSSGGPYRNQSRVHSEQITVFAVDFVSVRRLPFRDVADSYYLDRIDSLRRAERCPEHDRRS